MRKLHKLLYILAPVLLLVGCINKGEPTYILDIATEFSCTYDEQCVEIPYSLDPNCNRHVKVSASSEAEWLTIDTSTPGVIKIDVEYNGGYNRTTEIVVSATGHKSATLSFKQYSIPPATANHTLIFYFFGTSLKRYFDTNLKDAENAIRKGILGNNNRVMYLLQEDKYTANIGEICFDSESGTYRKIDIETISLSGPRITSETIGENISKIVDIAPAERYGIIFAGHGQGWVPRSYLNGGAGISTLSAGLSPFTPAPGAEVTRAFGEYNVQMDISEIAEGINLSNTAMDYILFDACFMSNIEAIYDLRNVANYIIASPCEIMGRGFPYERTLPYLFEDEGRSTNYIKAAESYYLFYRDEYVGDSRCGSVAVIDCSTLEPLAEATKEVLRSAVYDYDKSYLQTYEGQDPHYFYDFGEWVNVAGTDRTALSKFNTAIRNSVVAKFTLPTFYSAYGRAGTYPINELVYSGLTTSAPNEVFTPFWEQTEWYKSIME